MNAWIILLFLLLGNSGCGCQQRDGSCRNDDDRDCGCGRGRERDFQRDTDCDCDRDRDRRDSGFEPRFDARPFDRERETCGCEEKNN